MKDLNSIIIEGRVTTSPTYEHINDDRGVKFTFYLNCDNNDETTGNFVIVGKHANRLTSPAYELAIGQKVRVVGKLAHGVTATLDHIYIAAEYFLIVK